MDVTNNVNKIKLKNLIASLDFLVKGVEEYIFWLGKSAEFKEKTKFISKLDNGTNWEGIFYAILTSSSFEKFVIALKPYISAEALNTYKFPLSGQIFDKIKLGVYPTDLAKFINRYNLPLIDLTAKDIENSPSYQIRDNFIKWYEVVKTFGEQYLAKQYIDKNYDPYLTILERRFRENWDPKFDQKNTMQITIPEKLQIEVVK